VAVARAHRGHEARADAVGEEAACLPIVEGRDLGVRRARREVGREGECEGELVSTWWSRRRRPEVAQHHRLELDHRALRGEIDRAPALLPENARELVADKEELERRALDRLGHGEVYRARQPAARQHLSLVEG
jgi:hypothetical protein